MKYLIILICLVFQMGCGSTKVRNRGFDKSARSIAIPTTGHNFIEELKDYFLENGYKVVSYMGGEVTTQINSTESLTKREFNTRYMLRYSLTNVELFCMMEGEYQYNISIVDTRTGEEVLNIRGEECASNIAKRVISAIEES